MQDGPVLRIVDLLVRQHGVDLGGGGGGGRWVGSSRGRTGGTRKGGAAGDEVKSAPDMVGAEGDRVKRNGTQKSTDRSTD